MKQAYLETREPRGNRVSQDLLEIQANQVIQEILDRLGSLVNPGQQETWDLLARAVLRDLKVCKDGLDPRAAQDLPVQLASLVHRDK